MPPILVVEVNQTFCIYENDLLYLPNTILTMKLSLPQRFIIMT